jgi:hypothetical protein
MANWLDSNVAILCLRMVKVIEHIVEVRKRQKPVRKFVT